MKEPKDVIKQIKKATRRKFSADDKIRIVLEGLRGETSISEICRREKILERRSELKKKTILERKKFNGKIMKMELRPSPNLEA